MLEEFFRRSFLGVEFARKKCNSLFAVGTQEDAGAQADRGIFGQIIPERCPVVRRRLGDLFVDPFPPGRGVINDNRRVGE